MKLNIPFLAIGGIVIIVIALIGYSIIPSRYELSENNLKFTGAFGVEIPILQIQEVEIKNTPIKINSKRMGFNGGNIRKGTFHVEEIGICHLILENTNPPYLMIKYDNGKYVIVNYSDTTETWDAQNDIKSKWNKKTVYNNG